MRPIVYLGPSLPCAEARQLIDAEFRPPVRRGDLAAEESGRVIVILDGEFGQSLSVSPKEILARTDRGFRVVGASSMGALRAAELAAFGVEGYGWIFEGYRTGRIVGDDEVALMYSPPCGPALTVPLVNVRYWLDRVLAEGVIDDSTRRRVFRRARAIYFGDRTPARLLQELRQLLGAAALQSLLASAGGAIPDVKAEDARLALRTVAATLRDGTRHRDAGTLPFDPNP
jgi:hypothetical protein